MPDLPPDLVDLQRAATAAWEAVAAYRQAVMAARRAEAGAAAEGGRVELRPWSDEENAEYRRLHVAAVEAQEALRDGIAAEAKTNPDVDFGIETVQGLHKAARDQ